MNDYKGTEIPYSEEVRRVLFFAKYEAFVKKQSHITIEDLKAGIAKEIKEKRA